MEKPRLLWMLGLLSFVIGFIAVALSAQAQRSIASLDDLVTEVRGLRADMAQASAASIKVQLVTARLQLQEERISGAARQLADLQATIAAVRRDIRQQQQIIAGAANPAGELSVGQQNEIRQEAVRRRQGLDQQRQREEELRRQEAELTTILATERGRWTSFNDQLDAIEAAVAPKPAR
jgi:hypothetical protein